MTSTHRRVHVLVPFWGLAGGVIKILDYANHAVTLGKKTTLWAPPLPPHDDLVYSLPVLSQLLSNDLLTVAKHDQFDMSHAAIGDDDVVLFTDPTDHERIERATAQFLGPRLIHLIQGTRHGNPRWQEGRNVRLLHLPMSRIAVSEQVTNAIRPFTDSTFPVHTIPEGHDCEYFAGRPMVPNATPGHTLRVLYMTWKSDLGNRVAEALAGDDRFRFIAVHTQLGWPTLRNRYHGADIFLAAPGPEEGFYLPGIEAMAAGLAMITSVVGGNASYVEDGLNAFVVGYDDVSAHVDALHSLANDPELRRVLVAGGAATAKNRTLDSERDGFAQLLNTLER